MGWSFCANAKYYRAVLEQGKTTHVHLVIASVVTQIELLIYSSITYSAWHNSFLLKTSDNYS